MYGVNSKRDGRGGNETETAFGDDVSMEKNTENTKMTNIFESLNHTDTILKNIKSIFLSLGSIIGSFILFSYFSFYVRSIPSNISLGSLSLILLMIAAWAVIVSVFFILIYLHSSRLGILKKIIKLFNTLFK